MYNLQNTFNIQVLLAGKQQNLYYKALSFEKLLNLQQNTHIQFREQSNPVAINRLINNLIEKSLEHRCLLQKKYVTIFYLNEHDIFAIKEDLKYLFKKEERKLKKLTMPLFYARKTLRGLAQEEQELRLKTLTIGFISTENNYVVFFNNLYAMEFRHFLNDYKKNYEMSHNEQQMRNYVYKQIEEKDEQYQLFKS